MQVVQAKAVLQFIIHMGAGGGRDNRAGTGAGNDLRQQAMIKQCLDHPRMEKPEHRAATEHQRRAAITMAGAQKKVLLFLQRNDAVIHLVQIVQRATDFFYVTGNQILGAQLCFVIQSRLAHAAQIPVQTFIQHEQQVVILTAKTQVTYSVQPLANRAVVIAFAGVILLPFVQPVLLIPGSRQLGPILIMLGLLHTLHQLLTSWAFKEFHGLFLRGGCSGQRQPWRVNGCCARIWWRSC